MSDVEEIPTKEARKQEREARREARRRELAAELRAIRQERSERRERRRLKTLTRKGLLPSGERIPEMEEGPSIQEEVSKDGAETVDAEVAEEQATTPEGELDAEVLRGEEPESEESPAEPTAKPSKEERRRLKAERKADKKRLKEERKAERRAAKEARRLAKQQAKLDRRLQKEKAGAGAEEPVPEAPKAATEQRKAVSARAPKARRKGRRGSK